MAEAADAAEGSTAATSNMFIYRCRMCRRRLFSSADLAYHTQATHRLSQRGNKAKDSAPKGCSSHFLAEPLEWMSLADVQGKIHCPQCDARLGSYNWSGTQCSCGSWVTPAIQITQSRVDQLVAEVSDARADHAVESSATEARDEGQPAEG